MHCYKKLWLGLALTCSAYQTIAAIDPVAQSISPAQLPKTVVIGDSLSVIYTLTNNKKFPVKLTISSESIGKGIVLHDTCNGTTLAKKDAPGSQCSINISIDPVSVGALSWRGTMHYDHNDVPLTPLTTVVENQTGQVVGDTDVDLPAETMLNQTPYPFTFRFKNTSATSVTGNGQVSSNVSSYQIGTNDCINKTLTQNQFCLISGMFSPDATGHVRIEGAFNYNSGKDTARTATETVVIAQTGQIAALTEIPLQNPTYVNQGPYKFRFKFTNTGTAPVTTGNGVFEGHGAPVSVTNNCLNKTLNPTEYCTIEGTFSPVATGSVTLLADYVYSTGRASTSTKTRVDASEGLVAQVIQALPPNAGENTNNPVEFRFTNASGADLNVTQQLSLPNVSGITNTCPNSGTFTHISPGNVCTISGTFNSSGSTSVQILSATMSPTNSPVPPATASMSTLTQPTTSIFIARWPRSLRVSAGANSMPYQFSYQLNNNLTSNTPVTINFIAPSTVTMVQQAATLPPNSSSDPYFKSYYNCGAGDVPFNPNSSLSITIPANPGGVCNVNVTFLVTSTVPPNPYTDNFTMAFSVPSGFPSVVTPLSYATGEQIQVNGTPLTRTITFKNNCAYPVYYALHGASVQAKNISAVTCTTTADCFNGSSCYGGECQWIQPVPTNGYEIAASGGSTTVDIPMYDNAIKLNLSNARDVTWGGNLAGRVGCTAGQGCTVNDCGLAAGGAIGQCSTGIGSARSPISASEFTLQADDPLLYSDATTNEAADNYNIQLIDGITVPSTMAPTNGTFGGASAPYTCGGAGLKTSQQAPLASCPWTFTPPSSDYLWVEYSASPTPCATDGDCGGDKCGLMVNPTGTAVVQKGCGAPIFGAAQPMYWTADAVCKIDPTFGAPFNCSGDVSTIMGNTNTSGTPISNMYACTGSQLGTTCYGNNVDTCCGCFDWATNPSATDVCPSVVNPMATPNPGWLNQVKPLIQWAKTGCPTAYAYPYDDPSSSFTCLVNQPLTIPQDSYDGAVNTTNYEVEFCPQ